MIRYHIQIILFIIILFSKEFLFAQSFRTKKFPFKSITIQYGGSIGKYALGYGRINRKQNLEFIALFGHYRDPIRKDIYNLNFKSIISPFLIYRKQNALRIKPIQIGFSINQVFNKELKLFWDEKYPNRYYWWPNNTRFHLHLGSEINYKIKPGKQLSIYYEVNTNDLYLFSYLPNQQTMSINDIIYSGIGIKYIFK